MATLVHKTYFHNASGATNPVITLANTSAAGNWLIFYISADFPRLFTMVTDQGESFATIGIVTGSSALGGVFWLLQSTKTCSTITLTTTHGGSLVYYAAVYEVSGTNLQYVNQGGVNGGAGPSTHAFEQSTVGTSVQLPAMAGSSSGTTMYFSGCTGGLLNPPGTFSVAPAGWTLDQLAVESLIQVVSAYRSSSGTQQPTFSWTAASATLDTSGIFIQDSGPPSLIPTTTTIISNPDPSNLGIDVVFTANVSGAGTPSPSGTITFFIGGPGYGRDTGYGLDPYGDLALIVAVVAAVPNGAGMATAQFQTTALAVGSYFAYAVYSGDSTYTSSTSPEIIQIVIAATTGTIATDFGNSTADVIWWHTGFTGYDEETLANEGLINTGGTPNIPWLLGLSVSMGNAMTEAIAKQNIIYCEPEWGWDGGGGGNESGASQIGAGGSSGGLLVSW